MRKFAFLLITSGIVLAPCSAQEHIHRTELKHKLFSKGSWIKNTVSAVWAEARNSPHEWGRGWDGFAKRVGSSAGLRAVKGVVEYSVASSWTHEDLRYRPSNLEGKWPRVRYAVVHTFWVPRDVGSSNTFAYGRTLGAFTAGQVSRAWMPERVATFGAGMSTFGVSLGLDVGLNVVREFWPRRQ